MYKRMYGAAVVLLLTCLTVPAENLTTVAVMDFGGRSVSGNEAATLADRFRSELSRNGVFDVMERAEMEMVLREQAFQQTGCVDQSCAVEAGQLIAVQKIVSGMVSKVGAIYSVNVKLIDVATGRIDKNIAEDCDCPIERLLTETMGRMAAILSGKEVKGSTGLSVRRGDASLFIKTEPESASVYLDGALQDGRTPVTLENVTAGRHELRVTKGDYEARVSVNLTAKKVERVELTLQKRMTVLKVMSDPSEAGVYLDRKVQLGKRPDQITPALFDGYEKSEAHVWLAKAGYLDTLVILPIVRNRENSITVEMREASTDVLRAQQKALRKGKHRRIGLTFSLTGVALLAGGTVTFFSAQSDYDEAESIKQRLEQSLISSGPEYDSLVEENKSKTDSGELKSVLSYALWGAGAVAAGLGIVLFF